MPIVTPTTGGAVPNVSTIASVNTFADVRLLGAGVFPVIEVLGGTTVGDGQDGVFYWKSTSVAADDGFAVLAPSAGGTGRWIRIYGAVVQSGIAPLYGFASRTVAAKAGDIVSVKDFKNSSGTTVAGDGSQDDTTGIQAAITWLTTNGGGICYFPRGTYKITAILNVADTSYVHLFGDGYGSVIKKGFNGDMISLGLKGEMSGLRLDGQGATFTGRGVIIATGGGGDGWQSIHDNTILDTASYCIEYTASGSGWMSRIVNNRLDTYNLTTFAVKYPASDSNGPRTLCNNVALGPLADFSACDGVTASGNTCGEGPSGGPYTVPGIQITSSATKAVVVGNTFDGGNTSITIKGNLGVFVGNVFNGGYTLGAGATNTLVAFNTGTAGGSNYDTDSSAVTSNNVYSIRQTYTPTWTGSVSNPAIGNGTITASWQRDGRTVNASIVITMGNSTTFGTGTYTFGLPSPIPAPGAGNHIGKVMLQDASSGDIYNEIAFITGSGIQVYLPGAGGGAMSPTAPFTLAQNDVVMIEVTYGI